MAKQQDISYCAVVWIQDPLHQTFFHKRIIKANITFQQTAARVTMKAGWIRQTCAPVKVFVYIPVSSGPFRTCTSLALAQTV